MNKTAHTTTGDDMNIIDLSQVRAGSALRLRDGSEAVFCGPVNTTPDLYQAVKLDGTSCGEV